MKDRGSRITISEMSARDGILKVCIGVIHYAASVALMTGGLCQCQSRDGANAIV